MEEFLRERKVLQDLITCATFLKDLDRVEVLKCELKAINDWIAEQEERREYEEAER